MFPNFTEYLKKFDALGLNPDECMLTGGAVMAVHGLRDCKDLDVFITNSLWEKLKQEYPEGVKTFPGYDSLFINDIEFLSNFREENPWTVEQQFQEADVINGRKYQTLEKIKFFKKRVGREKDLKDIELIENYENQL